MENGKRKYAWYKARRAKENDGVMYSRNKQLYELPEIGTNVIVNHLWVHPRTYGSDLVKTHFRVEPQFMDERKCPFCFV